MLQPIESANADELWLTAADRLLSRSQKSQASRAGTTQESLHAVLVLNNPRNRWVVSRSPAINPAFAVAEVVWILRGRNDSAFLNYFNQSLPRYAGSGSTYHGAYGFRLRTMHGIDQLHRAYEALSSNPDSRQAVLQIWSPTADLPAPDGSAAAPDIPCNICSLLKVRSGRLHWTQIMRSNDLYRGLPYNIVQFTTLQEVMAGWLRLELGNYLHFADSLHVYDNSIGSIAASKMVDSPPNQDSLCASYAETELYLEKMERLIESITHDSTSVDALVAWLYDSDLPQAWRNLAVMLVSEGCRKRRAQEPALQVIETCTNPLLRLLMVRWRDRLSGSSLL